MRSPNKRSRSKSNRQKPLGNIVNRVFDSSGPAGKVRGTPQQIIDKYLTQARDAQLSGDRVASENFMQHAEHYARMLTEAQAEMAREAEARREQHQNQQDRQQQGGGSQGGGQQQADNRGDNQQGARRTWSQAGDHQPDREPGSTPATSEDQAVTVLDGPVDDSGESGLVETPEEQAGSPDTGDAPATEEDQGAAEAKPAPRNRRRTPRKPTDGEPAKPRAPRKPRAKQGDNAQPTGSTTQSAAE